MSCAPRSRPIKRSKNGKTSGVPGVQILRWFQRRRPSSYISRHSKKAVIFAQDDADAVFYIKKGKVKVAVISKQERKP